MASKKSGARRDRFINRYRGRVTTNANSSTEVVESFNTGMGVGRTDPLKWIVTHFAVWPNRDVDADLDGGAGQRESVRAQLAVGTQTAFLNSDDMQLVCEAVKHMIGATLVGYSPVDLWPLVGFLPAPVPVFSQNLSVIIGTSTDCTNMQSKEMAYEIGYVLAPISQEEIVEYYAAYGQA